MCVGEASGSVRCRGFLSCVRFPNDEAALNPRGAECMEVLRGGGQVTRACEAAGVAVADGHAAEFDHYALHESKREETEAGKPRQKAREPRQAEREEEEPEEQGL